MVRGVGTVPDRGTSVSVPWGPDGDRVEAEVLHYNRSTRSVQVTFKVNGERVTRWFSDDDVRSGWVS